MTVDPQNTANAPAPARPPEWLRIACSAAAIVAVGVLAYFNSFHGSFVFDDISSIADNPTIRQLWPPGLVLCSAQNTTLGRPLLNLSFAINYAWSGTDVTSYHVVNLAIHLCAALVLFGLIRRTLQRPIASQFLGAHGITIASLSAMIWTVHPVQTESVTYVVQRAESLVGLFYLLTLYCSLRAATSVRSTAWSIAAVVACLCGVASKEVIVSAPLAVVVYDHVFLRQVLDERVQSRRKLYLLLFLCWLPLIGLVVAAGGRESTVGFAGGISAWDYAMTQFVAIVRYLGLCFLPKPLVLDYGTSVVRDYADILPSAAIVLALFTGSLLGLHKHSWLGFLGFAFFAVLSPSSSFIPIVTQTVAVHRMYLPLAAVVVCCVVVVWHLTEKLFKSPAPQSRSAAAGIATVVSASVVIGLAYMTWLRNGDYQNPRRLWETNIATCPDSLRPYAYRAALSLEDGNTSEAVAWYDRAIAADQHARQTNTRTTATDSQLAIVYYGRSVALARQNQTAQAADDLDRAFQLHPESSHNRGLMLESIGRDEEALQDLTKSISETASNDRCLFDRARVLTRLNRYEEAIVDLTAAIKSNPHDAEYRHLRGTCYVQLGRNNEALNDLTAAIRIHPGFAQAIYDRGLVYASQRQYDKAILDFSTVLRISPAQHDALLIRAKCFYFEGRIPQATIDYQNYESRSGKSDSEFADRLKNATTSPPPNQ